MEYFFQRLLAIIITVVVLKFVTPYVSRFWEIASLNLFKKIPSNEIKRIKTVKLKNQNLYRYAYVGIVIVCLVGISIMGVKANGWLIELQTMLFSSDSVYFVNFGVWIILPVFIFVLVVGLGICCWLSELLLPNSMKDLIVADQVKSGFPYNLRNTGSMFLTAGMVFGFICLPFVLLALRDYKAVFSDRIVANNYFDLANKTYTFDEVKRFTVVAVRPREDGDSPFVRMNFEFNDGKVVDFVQGRTLGNVSSDHIEHLYKILKDNNVKMDITKPDDLTINASRLYCPMGQKSFNKAFGLNTPIKENCDPNSWWSILGGWLWPTY